jgi:predicted nucleotidyltransferase
VTSLEAALRQISSDLTQAHVPFALIGGLAVSARTEPRFTRDADIAVAVAGDAEAEALILSLRASGYRIGTLIEQEAAGRLATVRLTRSTAPSDPVVDLLFASSGIEPEIVEAADVIELLPRLHIRVGSTGHLIALKVLSRDDATRPQDLGDLRALLRVASPAEMTCARAAVALIAARGYHRQRDLEAELNAFLRSQSG